MPLQVTMTLQTPAEHVRRALDILQRAQRFPTGAGVFLTESSAAAIARALELALRGLPGRV